ncbi:MAG: ethanolamine utilization protein EutN [Calditrichaeota bacterium]|nr:MAG: ethanolamine utilization protein EutN [Calditrichota bacterium]
MNLAKVIGTIWATQKDENLVGAKMQIIQPVDHREKATGGPIVAVDTIGAGPGELVYFTTAREATIPYPTRIAPIDASIVGIVDWIDRYE